MSNGEISWTDGDYSKNETPGEKAEFVRLSEGKSVIRIISNVPYKYSVHKGVKAEGEKGFGRKIKCAKASKDDPCPLCEQGHTPGSQYMFEVIDKKTGTTKLLDISWQIFSQIKGLVQNTEVWGDCSRYDIEISKNPNSRGPSDYYLVQPIPPKPLTAAEQLLRDNVNVEELKRRTEALSYESVQKILAKVLNGGKLHLSEKDQEKLTGTKSAAQPKAASTNGKANGKITTAPAPELVDDDLDSIFPDYSAQSS